jgi:hypothetical protein
MFCNVRCSQQCYLQSRVETSVWVACLLNLENGSIISHRNFCELSDYTASSNQCSLSSRIYVTFRYLTALSLSRSHGVNLGLCCGGARFESRPGHQVIYAFFHDFSHYLQNIPLGYYLDSVTIASFQILSNSSILSYNPTFYWRLSKADIYSYNVFIRTKNFTQEFIQFVSLSFA